MEVVASNSDNVAREGIKPGLRVLITGPTGWFGRTALELAQRLELETLLIGSQAKDFFYGGRTFHQHAWNKSLINEFKPELVIDTAFITREKAKDLGLAAYVNANRQIMAQSYELAELESVRTYVGFSSGAAVATMKIAQMGQDPYGNLKKEFEEKLELLGRECKANVVLIRPWSVAGTNLTKPEIFAFSNLIMQARTGLIKINATGPVWRRYCSVDELLIAGVILGDRRKFTLLESGGELIEIHDLAQRINNALGSKSRILRESQILSPQDEYHSDGTNWEEAVRSIGLVPKTLDQIIKLVDAELHPTTR